MWIYIVPKKFVAEAVIEVRPSSNDVITSSFFGTQFESIKSQESLSAVSDQLELPDKWMVRQDVVIRILKGIIDASITLQRLLCHHPLDDGSRGG